MLTLVIARKISKRTDVAIQPDALCGMPGRCGGLPDGFGWIAASLALLAMTKVGTGMSGVVHHGVGAYPTALSLRAR